MRSTIEEKALAFTRGGPTTLEGWRETFRASSLNWHSPTIMKKGQEVFDSCSSIITPKNNGRKRRLFSTETSPILSPNGLSFNMSLNSEGIRASASASEEHGNLLSFLKAKDSQSYSIQNQSSEDKLDEIAESML